MLNRTEVEMVGSPEQSKTLSNHSRITATTTLRRSRKRGLSFLLNRPRLVTPMRREAKLPASISEVTLVRLVAVLIPETLTRSKPTLQSGRGMIVAAAHLMLHQIQTVHIVK